MAVIDIPLATGLDLEKEPKQTPGLRSNKNTQILSTGEATVRPGYTTHSTTARTWIGTGSGTDPHIDNIRSLFATDYPYVLADMETVSSTFDKDTGPSLLQWDSARTAWKEVAKYNPPTWEVHTISSGGTDVFFPSLFKHADDNYRIYTWTYDDKVFRHVCTEDEKTVIKSNYLIDVDNSVGNADVPEDIQCRTFRITNATDDKRVQLVFYPSSFNASTISNWGLDAYEIDGDDPGQIPTKHDNLFSEISKTAASELWDACEFENSSGHKQVAVCWEYNSDYYIGLINSDCEIADTVAIGEIPNACCLFQNGDNLYILFQGTANNNLYCIVYDENLDVVTAKTLVVESVPANEILSITAAPETREDSGWVRCFFTMEHASGDEHRFTGTALFDSDPLGTIHVSLFPESFAFPGLQLASKCFSHNGEVTAMMRCPDRYQPTYFMISTCNALISSGGTDIPKYMLNARILGGKASLENLDAAFLPEISTSGNNLYWGAAKQIRLREVSATSYEADEAVVGLAFDLAPAQLQAIDREILTGGIPTLLGGRCSELGCPLAPSTPVESSTASTGGSVADGTYSYKLTFEFIDQNGDLHQSAPSTALELTVSEGTGTAKVNILSTPGIWNPFFHLQQYYVRSAETSEVRAVLWRTTDGGTNYYRVDEEIVTFSGSLTTTYAITISDTLDDTTLETKQLLYTTSSELENRMPPAAKAGARIDDKVYLVSMDDPNTVKVSKPKITSVAPTFTSQLDFDVPGGTGGITAIATEGNRIYCFKKDTIWVTTGTGWNALGQGGGYDQPVRIAYVGVTNQNKVKETSAGIFFQTPSKGIWRILNGSVEYIGDKVDDYNSDTLYAIAERPDKNQVLFFLDTPIVLKYDYYHGTWGTWTTTDSLIYAADTPTSVYASNNDDDVVEITGYGDNGTGVAMEIITPWIKTGSIDGFQRIRRVALTGEYRADTTITILVYNDHSDTVMQTITHSLTGYSAGDPISLETGIKYQKCKSIAFKISVASATVEPVRLSTLSLDIMTKKGLKIRNDA